MLNRDKITEIFCIADDFCKEFEKNTALKQMTVKGAVIAPARCPTVK